jgi:hypothetical protein
MVIALRVPVTPFQAGIGSLSLEGIQDVWELVLVIGLIAVLLSWAREGRGSISNL